MEQNTVPPPNEVEKALVTAKMRLEDVQWAHDLRPEYGNTPLPVPLREAASR